uniref:Small integral membrane protein 20 n=1 Tax=Sinocyclocheilus rhinocerous TaxID=307959 RepID=A0A673GD47_9TELE
MSANRRITLIFGGFITAVAVAFYPIFFHPLTHTEDYSKSLSQHMVTLVLCC